MKLMKVTFNPFDQEAVTYELGKKVSFQDRMIGVEGIALEATGQIVLELSGGNCILYGNAPYRLEALVDAAKQQEVKE